MMDQKVSVGWQVVFTIIGVFVPFVWLYPFYKIRKIIRMILIRLLVVGLSIVPLLTYFMIGYISSTEPNPDMELLVIMPLMITYTAGGLINIPFIIKWSKAWNRGFTNGDRCDVCKCSTSKNCKECSCHVGQDQE